MPRDRSRLWRCPVCGVEVRCIAVEVTCHNTGEHPRRRPIVECEPVEATDA